MRPAEEFGKRDGTHRQLKQYVDEIVPLILAHDFDNPSDNASNRPDSGHYIMFWRLRSYLYKVALDCVRAKAFENQYEIMPLRYEDEIRTLAQDKSLKAIRMDDLTASSWYAQDLKNAINKWAALRFGG
jgi:hypothetical protein